MKITADTTVQEVNDKTKDVFYAMCGEKSGISDANLAMDNFMDRLNNNEFSLDREPCQEEEFIPTEELAERIVEGYHNILDEIKELKLK